MRSFREERWLSGMLPKALTCPIKTEEDQRGSSLLAVIGRDGGWSSTRSAHKRRLPA